MRRLQVRILSGVLGRVVELVDTRHLNCLSPNGECGFDSRPDYKIFGYAIPPPLRRGFYRHGINRLCLLVKQKA